MNLFQRLLLALLIVIACVEGYVAIVIRDNDLVCHRNNGRFFLEHNIGRDHYPPARALMNVSLAVAPYRATRAVCYLLALAALFVCWRVWNRTSSPPDGIAVPAGIFAALLLLPYLLRDLDECGLQLYLLFFLTMGIGALASDKPIQAGFWFATATAYKVVPLLCLPFLLWKRQWRAAGAMAVFLGLWCAAPGLYLGWDGNWRAHEAWYAEVSHIRAARQAYPSLREREEPKTYNLSVQATLARYMETYPPGHPLHLEHPAFVQFGALSQHTAYYLSQGILLVLGIAFLGITRFGRADASTPARFSAEWAAICGLCAILSPSCWKQHLVLMLPCAYLIFTRVLTQRTTSRYAWGIIGVIAVVTYLGRKSILGDLAMVALSYKIDTFCMVALVVWPLVVHDPSNVQSVPDSSTTPISAAPSGNLARAA